MIDVWLLFALLSALFAGITSVIAKIGLRDTDSSAATAVRTVVILLFTWLMVFIAGSGEGVFSIGAKPLLFLILSGVATGASWLCYFRALQLGDVNKVAPIDKSSTVLTMLLAFVLLGEPVSAPKLFGMAAIGAGTLLMAARRKADGPAGSRAWIIYASLSAFFAALTSILGKVGIQDVESNLGTAVRTVVVLIMAWIVVLARKKLDGLRGINKKGWLFIILSGITTGLSWLCYYRALQDGPASVVVPVDKLSILVTVLFSCLILKEKLNGKSLAGLAMIVCGTMALLL